MVNKITNPPSQKDLIDKVNEIIDDKQDTLTSANAGNCINIAMGSPSGLPSEYQELEYLQSSGTQYIDTGIVLNSPATITTVGQFLIGSSSVPVTMWGFLGSNRSLPRWGCSIYNSKWLLDLNNTSLNAPSSDTSMHTFVQNCTSDTYDGLIDGESIYSEEIPIASDTTYTSNTLSVYLFARNNDNTAGNFSTSKIYSYNIVQNGVEVLNLIPAKRKSDNVFGMYDTVSGNFLTNSGTGTFIAGGNVEEITKINFVNDAGYITGITSSDVTTALGYTPYNSSNPDGYITSADLPTNHVTTDTAQTISANKTFTGVTKFQNGSANGCVVLGANAEGTSVSNNVRKLGRMSFHTYENTVDCAFVSTDSQSDNGVNTNYVEFGGRPGDRANTSPDVLRFTVVKVHNSTANADKVFGLEMSYSGGANFGVQPKYNGTDLALSTDIPTVNNPTITFTQGGTTKGTITLNQSGDQTIAFDAGGGSDVEAFTAAEVQAIWEAN